MKKFTLFLAALFISMMSFATTVTFDWSSITVTQTPTGPNVYTQGDITLTFEKNEGSNIPAENKEGAIRMYKGTTLKIAAGGQNNLITKVVFTQTTSSYSATNLTYNNVALPGNEWSLSNPKSEVLLYAIANARFKKIEVTYGEVADNFVAAPAISGDVNFIASTNVSITAAEGVKIYYTLDGTEPTATSTEYTAPFEVNNTTTVKAIAYKGENASEVTSQTFTKATAVTCAEAASLATQVSGNNVMTTIYYVLTGYVTNVIDTELSSGQQRFWVADTKDGGQVLQSYYCNVPQVLKVGDKVQMFGQLTKYNSTPQMKNGQVTLLPADPELKVIGGQTGSYEDGWKYTYFDLGTIEEGQTASKTIEFEATNIPAKYTYYNEENEMVEADNFIAFAPSFDAYYLFDITVSENASVTEDYLGGKQYRFPLDANGNVKGSITVSLKKDLGGLTIEDLGVEYGEAYASAGWGLVDGSSQISAMFNVNFTLTEPNQGGDGTALEDATVEAIKAVKVIENGVVYIIKNGVKYTVTGVAVK